MATDKHIIKAMEKLVAMHKESTPLIKKLSRHIARQKQISKKRA